jgi:serine protease Do
MRLKTIGWLALTAGISLLSCAPVRAAAPDKLYAMLAPSVWRVVVADKDGKPFAEGSAVVVAPEVLLTNCHVLKSAKSVYITRNKVTMGAHLQYADPERDMCQIVARDLKAPPVRIGDSDSLVVGQRVYALGNPLGLELTLSDGLVSALRLDDRQRLRLIQISAPISHGSSGGGLFDKAGRLVGITSAGFESGQNLGLAIPIAWQRELPGRSRDAYAADSPALRKADLPPADGKPSAAALAAAAAATTTMTTKTTEADTRPAAPAVVHAKAPVASGYARIDQVDKLVALEPDAGTSYEEFLKRPYPRAFALAIGGGSYSAWTNKPKVPGDDPDPAVRVLTRCEAQYHRSCTLYAVDDVVVYRQPARQASR